MTTSLLICGLAVLAIGVLCRMLWAWVSAEVDAYFAGPGQ